MQNNLLDEVPITLSEARKEHIPQRGDRPVAPSTVTRWIHKGIRAGDGSIVRLEAVKIGRSLMTTSDAIRRFFEELTVRSAFAAARESADDPTVRRERPVRALRDHRLI